MKKLSQKSPSFLRVVLLVSLLLLATVVAWRIVVLQSNVNGGSHPLSRAESRHVENMKCSGECDNVLLVDEASGTRLFAGGECPTCIEANIWAGETREGQITINGYAFYDGVQTNLKPKTFGTEVLDGRDISWELPMYPPGKVFPSGGSDRLMNPGFIIHLKDTGDENVIDTVEYIPTPDTSSENITIVTDRASGRITAFDTCTQTNKNTKIYALYQAAELHGPNATDSYDVNIDHKESLESGTITGGTNVFTKTFFGNDLEDRTIEYRSIHVTADVGDATFDFDLVKDTK